MKITLEMPDWAADGCDPETYLRLAEELAQQVAQREADSFLALVATPVVDLFDSPIERLLWAAIVKTRRADGGTPWALDQDMRWPAQPRIDPDDHDAFIGINLPVGTYRVDILIRHWASHVPWLAVECDGHDYHERTKQQAAHDRRRDRWMQAQGIDVMRFTGSEIYNDPSGCAMEVMRHLAVRYTRQKVA